MRQNSHMSSTISRPFKACNSSIARVLRTTSSVFVAFCQRKTLGKTSTSVEPSETSSPHLKNGAKRSNHTRTAETSLSLWSLHPQSLCCRTKRHYRPMQQHTWQNPDRQPRYATPVYTAEPSAITDR